MSASTKPKRRRLKFEAHAFNEGGFIVRGTLDPMAALAVAVRQLDDYQLGEDISEGCRPIVDGFDLTREQAAVCGDAVYELLAKAQPGLYRIVPARPDDDECDWRLHTAKQRGPGVFEGVQFL